MSRDSKTIYNPQDIIKKEAGGLGDDTDLGEVQEVSVEHIVTQKGILDKDKYYIPKNLVDRFEGGVVYFIVTAEQAKKYKEYETNLM
ncbi:MAG TPA: hypothetical protein VEW92_06325 [Nitrososphaeraceae archaeon]|jgi:hypothetical protein|nr:hypothetical protein [Nitrososphaeraceae archaeon]